MELGYNEALEKFRDFKENLFNKYIEEDLSESDTRSKILDYIFKDILGWDEFNIQREPRTDSGYIDYLFSTSTFKFVVEAKKQRISFTLPKNSNKISLNVIYNQNKEVVDQIRRYLFSKSLQIGIITNGEQFIIAKFINTDGTDWKKNTCIYYKDIEDIEKNFIDFYELFSRELVSKSGRIKIVEPPKVGKRISKDLHLNYKDSKLVRNALSNELISILSRVFEEIYKTESLQQVDILKKCYVGNEDIKKYNHELGSLFYDNPPEFNEKIAKVRNTKNTQQQISEEITNIDPTYTPDPIIIIGTAGAGKTTFIKNFIDIELDPKIKKVRPIIYLDFRLYTRQQIEDTAFIYNEIIEQLIDVHPDLNLDKLNILKTIYKKEIEQHKSVDWSYINDENNLNKEISIFLGEKRKNPIKHLEKISKYLNYQCNKRLCIIFDNVDQLSDETQNKVFTLSQSINEYLGVIALLSLREGYYFKWMNKPPINAYQSTVYHIMAPPYKEVLERRIKYALNNFEFKALDLTLENKRIGFGKGSLSILFENLYKTLFERENSEILMFLQETSYPNIREGLRSFKDFLLSAHTKINDYMSFDYWAGNKNGIPFWEFLKSVGLGFNYYYSSTTSRIFNLFDPSEQNSNHFTKIKILLFLKQRIPSNSSKPVFIKVFDLYRDFIKVGYSLDILAEEIQLLFDNKLIFTSEYTSDVEEEYRLNEESKISISSIGNYYLTVLLSKFSYFDLVLQDTPIYSEKFYEKIAVSFPHSDEHGNRDLVKRKETVMLFLDYLEEQEKIDVEKLEVENLDQSIIKNIVQDIRINLTMSLKRLDTVIATRYSTK